MLDFRQLQVFMAVWDKRSLSQAAEAIYLTQPTVSAHLKALEEQLGVRLFDRSSREVIPTAAGEVLYPFVHKILRLNRQAEESISGLVGEGRGFLEVGASNIPGQYLLPAILGQFRKHRPMVEIKLFIADTRSVIEDVLEGQIELGIVGAAMERKKLDFEPCFSDELTFVIANDNPLAGKRQIEIEEFLNQPLIVREKGSGTRLTIERALAQHGISMDQLNIVIEMGSTEAVRQGVKAGLGSAFISLRAVQDYLDCGILHAVTVRGMEIKRNFYMVTRKNRTLSPINAAFMDFIRQKSVAVEDSP